MNRPGAQPRALRRAVNRPPGGICPPPAAVDRFSTPLVYLYRSKWNAVRGICGVTEGELERGASIGPAVFATVGRRENRAMSALTGGSLKVRRFWTLADRAYDQCRRALLFLEWGGADLASERGSAGAVIRIDVDRRGDRACGRDDLSLLGSAAGPGRCPRGPGRRRAEAAVRRPSLVCVRRGPALCRAAFADARAPCFASRLLDDPWQDLPF
ncbi:MAG TPA: hypothetical protein VHB21_06315 [Minicystis sp.]|nr:hypothetical protein [Minicystis sp.]